GAAVLRVPARLVPVPAVVHAAVLGPGHHMRDAGGDLLVAPRAAVALALRARAADVPDGPLLALVRLGALEAEALPRPAGGFGRLVAALGLGAVAARGHGNTSRGRTDDCLQRRG